MKGVNFYGPKSEYIVSGSDCGNIFFWDKETESIVNTFQGDVAGVVSGFSMTHRENLVAYTAKNNNSSVFDQHPTLFFLFLSS